MATNDTPRFRNYKARKRDNWTSRRLAFKIFAVEIGWPAIGIMFVACVLLLGRLGWQIPVRLGGASGLTLFVLFFLWLPLWGLAILDKGNGFGVFIGRLMFYLSGSGTRSNYLRRAERRLAMTDEDLFDRYVRTRPASSR
jgi:hypothetical protein